MQLPLMIWARHASRLLIAASICLSLLSCAADQPPDFAFKLAVTDDGVYRVEYDTLGYAGRAPGSPTLELTQQGRAVAFDLDDGGDGRFGPGDSLTFVGVHPAGDETWFSPWTAENVYLLRAVRTPPEPSQMVASTPATAAGAVKVSPDVLTRHIERNDIRVALPATTAGPAESWYWKRQSYLDEPVRVELNEGPLPTSVRVSVAGLSADSAAAVAGESQHRVDVLLNGTVIAKAEWNGQATNEIRADAVAIAAAMSSDDAAAVLELRVPRRSLAGQSAPVIDVVLLNWVEVDFLVGSFSKPVTFTLPGRQRHYLTDPRVRSPVWIRPWRAAGLREASAQTDYLMIAHDSLLEAVEPLAAFHRERGLSVSVVDVEDVYEAFSHGIASPLAIREFIGHARAHWATPAPRYVLLVGDASWDVYGRGRGRNLVPTLQVHAYDELAASDNGFVALEEGNWRPDLAIGRIPAADATELSAVVNKLLQRYRAGPGLDWQHRAALVSDMNEGFQAISDGLAADLAGFGIGVRTIYPAADTDTSRQDQRELFEAFDDGQLLVHFVGHGGRFVWRTGPLDYKYSSDLFSATDVERLPRSDRLPLVLSMTCSSGPFDHPEVGSIAETFLMKPDGGAIGVLAASWRVPASQSFSSALMAELLQPGQSIGAAVLRAKQREPRRALVESYNFLGDPALELRPIGDGPDHKESVRPATRGTGR